jgi:hypothetical protein
LREKRESGETASVVSCGSVEARRSSEVSGLAEEPETALSTPREPPTEPKVPNSTVSRLTALEHLLDAVTALFDAGESARAKMFVQAWRNSRQ